jgi:hypothetical protein
MEAWTWLFWFLLRAGVGFAVPYLYGVVTDWPVHFLASGSLGYLAYSLTLTISRGSWITCWGERRSILGGRITFILSLLVGISVSLLAHVLWDYWPGPVRIGLALVLLLACIRILYTIQKD